MDSNMTAGLYNKPYRPLFGCPSRMVGSTPILRSKNETRLWYWLYCFGGGFEMSKEAFEKWWLNSVFRQIGVEDAEFALDVWQAACEYQRETDARLCDAKHANKTWKYAPRDEVAAAIRDNKGE